MKDYSYLWMMILLLFCVLSAYQVSSTTAKQHLQFTLDNTLDGVVPKAEYVTASSTVRSRLDCFVQCGVDPTCNVIAFNSVSKTCSRQRVGLMTSYGSLTVSYEPEWRHYRMGAPHCPNETYIADRVTLTCYKLVAYPTLKFDLSRLDCQSRGEDLVIFEPMEKGLFMIQWLTANEITGTAVAVGASDVNGTHRWVNGDRVDYASTWPLWRLPFSNNSDVILMSAGTFLLRAGTTASKQYICERPLLYYP